MKTNHLKSGWVRSFVFIIAIFLLVVFGLTQPHASEKVTNYANGLFQNKLKSSIPVMLGNNNKLPDIMSKVRDLREKMHQFKQGPKSNNPAFHLQSAPPLFREVSREQPRNLKSKQMHFMREINKLNKSKRNAARGSVIQANGETGSIRGTITCVGCGEGEIWVTASSDVPGPDAPILGEVYIPSPSGTYEITDLPLDTEIWVSAWWNKPGSAPFPDCGDYIGEYGDNPITLVDIPADGIDITLEEIGGGSITGEVFSDYCSGDDPIYITVWDGTAGASDLLGQTTVYGSGSSYAVECLPLETDVWVYGVCDPGGDSGGGPPVCGDYLDEYSENPLHISGDHSGIDITVNTPMPCGSIRGTITCAGCDEGEIWITASSDVPGPDAPILGEVYIPSPGGTYEITDLPLDTEMWVSAWWNKPGSGNFPNCGDYIGLYEENPIILKDDNKNPDNIDITIEEISITGQITFPCFGEGQIQISAWDGEVGPSNVIGLTYIDSPGYYFMTGLPHDIEIRIAAWWDKEQEWIGPPDYYDFVGEYGNTIILTEEEPCLTSIEISLEGDTGCISGEIICENCNNGQIAVAAFDEPHFDLEHLLNYTLIDSSEDSYTISGLPYETQIWIYVWWDKQQEGNPPPDCGDYFGECDENPITLTEVEPNVFNKDITLEEIVCGSISGRVTKDPGGEGMEGVYVDVVYDPINFKYRWAETDDSGEYTVPNLITGKYPVFVFNPTHSSYSSYEIYDDAPTFSSGNVKLVEVEPGKETKGIDFGIPEAVEIKGNVTIDGDVDVTVRALDPLYNFDPLFFGYGVTVITGSGNYTISGLHPDGCYMVFASREDDGYGKFYDNVIFPFAAELVCQPGENIDFNFQEPGCIEGEITDVNDGTKIQNISVGVYDSETGELEGTGISDESGKYRIMSYVGEVYILPANKTYNVKTFSLGSDDEYISEKVYDVEINGGECKEVNFELQESEIPDMSVIGGEGSGRVEDTVSVPVTVDNLQSQYPVFSVSILLDNTKLELSGFNKGEIGALFFHQPLWFCNLQGVFRFVVFSNITIPESGTIANLDFTMLSGTPGEEIALPLDAYPAGETTDGKIILIECTSNADCNDGLFCNGVETCDENGCCQPGTYPCPGQSCNETDHCYTPTTPTTTPPPVTTIPPGPRTTTTAGPSTSTTVRPVPDTTTTTTTEDTTSTTTSIPSTTTTTKKCPLVKIYREDSEEVALLRNFRDNVLSETPEGRELIKLYYQLSPAIVKTMEKDEAFKKEVKEMIDGVLGLIGEETK